MGMTYLLNRQDKIAAKGTQIQALQWQIPADQEQSAALQTHLDPLRCQPTALQKQIVALRELNPMPELHARPLCPQVRGGEVESFARKGDCEEVQRRERSGDW